MSDDLTAILVLHYVRPDLTLRCLASLARSDAPGRQNQILVIDNSTSQDFELPPEYDGHGIDLLRTGGNLGYAGGMNAGIEWAMERGAGFILLLNNDAVLEPSCVDRLRTFLASSPDAGVASPLILRDGPGDEIWATGSMFRPFRGLAVDPYHNRERSALPGLEPMTVDSVTGCAMMIKAGVVRDIGLLDEAYFAYYEDVDFCRRATLYGWRVCCVPEATARHAVASSSGAARGAKNTPSYFMVRNRIYFMRKYSRFSHFLLFCASMAAETLLKAVYSLVRFRPITTVALIHGFLDGVRGIMNGSARPVEPTVSACLITRDAGATVERCLESVKDVVNEIVVVDSGSTDDTLEICRRYTSRIFETTFHGDFSELRNTAAGHATGGWILALDADEYLSEELKRDLPQLVRDARVWGYSFRRVNFFGDTPIRFGHAGADSLVKLYRRRGSFFAYKVHEKVITQGSVKHTGYRVFHRQASNNYSAETFRSKWLLYIDIESQMRAAGVRGRGYRYCILAPVYFLFLLFKDLVILFGVLEGFRGLRMAWFRALYGFTLYRKIYAKVQQCAK